jgi:outer membrane protein OmpA-like peptidoglycan-associated protein
MKKTAIIMVGMTLLTGCVTDATTGERRVASTTWGAGIGALGGAAVGALVSKNHGKGALVGAAAGGLLGGGIGGYMDNQNAELRKELQGTGVSVTKVGNNVILNMPGNVTFKTNSSDLQGDFFSVLNSVAKVMNKYKKTNINVAGFTDSTGDVEFNMELSKNRAITVWNYLVSQGVDTNRFTVTGYGPERPIASNSTPAGREQNRRVEITLMPTEE